MRRGHLLDDRRRTSRTVLAGVVVIVVLGLALGGLAGLALTRMFDAAGVDDLARDFSEPRAAQQVSPR